MRKLVFLIIFLALPTSCYRLSIKHIFCIRASIHTVVDIPENIFLRFCVFCAPSTRCFIFLGGISKLENYMQAIHSCHAHVHTLVSKLQSWAPKKYKHFFNIHKLMEKFRHKLGKLIIRESTNLFVIQSVVVCTVAFRFLTDFFMFKRTVPREQSAVDWCKRRSMLFYGTKGRFAWVLYPKVGVLDH